MSIYWSLNPNGFVYESAKNPDYCVRINLLNASFTYNDIEEFSKVIRDQREQYMIMLTPRVNLRLDSVSNLGKPYPRLMVTYYEDVDKIGKHDIYTSDLCGQSLLSFQNYIRNTMNDDSIVLIDYANEVKSAGYVDLSNAVATDEYFEQKANKYMWVVYCALDGSIYGMFDSEERAIECSMIYPDTLVHIYEIK